MISKLVVSVLRSRPFRRPAFRLISRLYANLYRLLGVIAISLNDGVHPKHRILRYEQWFLDRIASGDVVLDLGSNTGMMVRILAEKATRVVGVELDAGLVEKARQFADPANVSYLRADITTFDYAVIDGPVDVVTLSNVLEHVADRPALLTRLRQSVPWRHPGRATLLIRVPLLDRDWLTVFRKEMGVEYRLDPTHHVEYTELLFEEELRTAGFEIEYRHVRFGELYAVCRERGRQRSA